MNQEVLGVNDVTSREESHIVGRAFLSDAVHRLMDSAAQISIYFFARSVQLFLRNPPINSHGSSEIGNELASARKSS